MNTENDSIKNLISIGTILAGPKYAVAASAVKAAYTFYKSAKQVNQVPSEMLALVEYYESQGINDPDQLIEFAKAEYENTKNNLDAAIRGD